ncbi:hypothetical protein HYW53_01010 [Candidatus Giovannonibacteria bacterium]|nr:hypothetical protein [Candidatus Giovannonibacteria bacterium]
MDEKNKGGDLIGGSWFWLILIVVLVIFFSARGGLGGIFSGGGIKIGAPSESGTVEEKQEESLRSLPPTRSLPEPQPLPQPRPLPYTSEGLPPASGAQSIFSQSVELSAARAQSENPDEEYIEIYSTYGTGQKILLSNWSIENSRGERYKIGAAAALPYAGQVNPESPILLEPGGRIFVVTGKSPLGANFRTNICTGYFNQYYNFEPRLSDQCPRPEDEFSARNFEYACINYLQSLPSCRQALEETYVEAPLTCRNWVNSEVNYSNCVTSHKNDKDFYKNEWHVYLGRPSEIWKNWKETITLRDGTGKIVSTISY